MVLVKVTIIFKIVFGRYSYLITQIYRYGFDFGGYFG